MGLLPPVLFALNAALSNALATVLQRRAALTVPQSAGFRLGLIADLLRRPVWIAGIAAVIAAGAGQAVALATGPLALVQPLFVMELPLALLIASLVTRQPLPGALWLAVAAVVAGLGLALAAASPAGNRTHVPLDRWLPALVVCAGAAVALAGAGLRRPPGRARAGYLGGATAICYALTAALMKSAVLVLTDRGLVAFLTTWQTYTFGATGIGALLLLEHAMQGGPLVASQPALTLGDATVGVALGVLLYGERLRSGWWLFPQLLGAALVCAGVLALARLSAPTPPATR
ncbi:DMT family transporter [Streptomyces sp. G-G2]|uniref:DMT family transporter n=1 Tax=Streptomyces sp. G-G2 TaxID=3046201 RepID=UPI0024B8B6E5|nr:DMT family transporter [Streptomyces sp. G-G2]MDJ0381983.1 DMT family transporter [Streptomyces sp. G-G2]